MSMLIPKGIVTSSNLGLSASSTCALLPQSVRGGNRRVALSPTAKIRGGSSNPVLSSAVGSGKTTRIQSVASSSTGKSTSEVSEESAAFSESSKSSIGQWWHTLNNLSPRARAAVYMASSMSLHFGAYEFVRNAGLAMFTSAAGFPEPAAFPFAYGLISPISVGLLYLYSQQLERGGPRMALRNITSYCLLFILCSAIVLMCGASGHVPAGVTRAVIGLAFLFQNSYVYMLASQQWSFLDSIVTPYEGAQWFGFMAGVSSVVCTVTASLVPILLPFTGLSGLYALTAVPLLGTLWCGDRAYALAQKHGFDPARQQTKVSKQNAVLENGTVSEKDSNRFEQALALFRRVPTLAALFVEGISFQSLNTILNVAMVRALKLEIPDDVARSAFTGQFYALVSGVSAAFQFVILPVIMKRFEPKQIWRIMPIIPFLVSLVQVLPGSSVSLRMLAGALFLTKLMDYSLRSVVYNMVYQPLDFESRFVGKEIIGVFGSRFGKSGISLLLSGLTASGVLSSSLRPLSFLSLIISSSWVGSTFWLSNLLPSKDEAQRTVLERTRRLEENDDKEKDD